MGNETFYLYDHANGEKFCIVGLENLIEWLNDVDDNLSFSLKGYEDFKKFEEEN